MSYKVHKHPSPKTETNPNPEWWAETESCNSRCFSWSIQSITAGRTDNILRWTWPGTNLHFLLFMLQWVLHCYLHLLSGTLAFAIMPYVKYGYLHCNFLCQSLWWKKFTFVNHFFCLWYAVSDSSTTTIYNEWSNLHFLQLQMGVIKAVRNSVAADGEVAALWVTHRLEELKYADGAIYMEDGQIIIQGDVATLSRFIKKKQARYFGHFELWSPKLLRNFLLVRIDWSNCKRTYAVSYQM